MFEDYPRVNLSFVCSRRNFFGALFQEMVVSIKTMKGGQNFRLSELGSIPDNLLAQIIPAMNPAYEIYVEENYLWTRHKQTGKKHKEFLLNEENRQSFNLFNGQTTLGEIARQLSRNLDWEEAKAFAHTRGLFLSLVDHLACLPGNPMEEDGGNVSDTTGT